MTERTCRGCGCTQHSACVNAVDGPCWWVEADLCSHCRMASEAMRRSLLLAQDLDCAAAIVELRHAEQLQRMLAWALSQPTMAVVTQVREGVDALLERAGHTQSG